MKLKTIASLIAIATSLSSHATEQTYQVTFDNKTYNVGLKGFKADELDEFIELASKQPWILKNVPAPTVEYNTEHVIAEQGDKFTLISIPTLSSDYRNLASAVILITDDLEDPIDFTSKYGSVVSNGNRISGNLGIFFNDSDGYSRYIGYPGWTSSLIYVLFPTTADTLNSLRTNAFALRNAFNLQSAKIAQGLKYDCTVYDQNNICVSFAGTLSDGKDFDGTTGALIVAHQPSKQFHWGAYVDQSMGSSASGGLTIKNGKSGYGAFAVWSENTDGSGVRVRAAANVGNVDMESTREAFETAEAGFGRSNIKSTGVQLEISKGYAINSTWGARPYVGYRKTTNTRAAYVETDDVTAPLSYSSLKQNVETLSAGVTFAHTESAKTSMFLTAGVDHEAKNRFDRYQASSPDIQGIDSIDLNDDKRKTYLAFSLAVNHDFDKNQRLGVTLNHRKQVSASGSVTSAMVQYSKGF